MDLLRSMLGNVSALVDGVRRLGDLGTGLAVGSSS